MRISAIEIMKLAAFAAFGWFLGKGIYSVIIELAIKACEKLSRCF